MKLLFNRTLTLSGVSADQPGIYSNGISLQVKPSRKLRRADPSNN